MKLDLELYREYVSVEEGVRLSVIDVSPERPEQTVVLVHGFGGNATQWQYQIERFSERNRVLAVDVRGQGRSVAPAGATYTMPTLLNDLITVLKERGVTDPFTLIGHSFGGAIVTDFALAYPERLRRLVLIASAGEYDLIRLYKIAFRLPNGVLRAVQPAVRGFVDANLVSLKRIFQQNLNEWRGWDKFPQLAVPTMVILGERDRVFPTAAFERVGELMPEAEVVNVGASAHMVMIERRDAVNRALERFMEEAQSHSRWRTAGQGGSSRLLAERPWLVHYESDVPHTIDVPRLPLTRLLDRAWRRFPRRPAIVYQGRKLTYKNLSAQSGRFANALQAMGVIKGARVMLLLPNVPQLVVAYYGVLRVGGIVVMGNPLAKTATVVQQAQQSGAEVLVTLTKFVETATAVRAQSGVRHVVLANVKDYLPLLKQVLFTWRGEAAGGHRLSRPVGQGELLWTKLLRQHRPEPPQDTVEPDDVAMIQFTGGTTAAPKGVTLTHRNLVANTTQTRAWMADIEPGREIILCVAPFSHVYGMTAGMNLAVSIGASMILLPTFDTEEVLQHIKQYKPTLFPGVPSMYVAINNFRGVRKFDVQSIRACLSGAAPLPIEVKERFEKLTKGKLVEGYGLSEASPVTHANPIFGRGKVGSIGLPLPNTEARVVDLRTGKGVIAGQIGELVVRGPQVMRGYWDDPAGTSAVLDSDGWLHTNDIARMDEDGYFQIISRRQDMWQADEATPAFPRDVEEVIYELPQVSEVVVVAIANQPIAFVSVKDKSKVPAKTIIAFCQRRLPPNQVPRFVIFVKDFPRSFIGKVLRRELVSQYAQQIEAEAGSVGEHLAGLGK